MEMDLKKIGLKVKEHLEKIASFTATPGEGITRLAFSLEARKTVNYINNEMKKIGLETAEDYAGSIKGRINGVDDNKAAIIIGSHYDSVKNGGNFDGIAGVICGLEIARLVKENNIKLKYPLEIIGLNDEEGARFGNGFFGSKAMLGGIDLVDLHKYKDEDGISIYQAMDEYGLNPESLKGMSREAKTIKSFIEIHVEQGPVLENNRKDIGVVEGIVGMQRYIIEIDGRADHVGTTPMDMRVDAMEVASRMISGVGDLARSEGNGTVATVGFIKNYPNVINIVPKKVQFSLDIRSRDNGAIERIANKVEQRLTDLSKEYDTEYSIECKLSEYPVDLDKSLIKAMSEVCEAKGYNYQKINSGAGHDSLFMAKYVDTAMLFVPSQGGRSHCKEEWTDYRYFAKAVDVVYQLLLDLNKN